MKWSSLAVFYHLTSPTTDLNQVGIWTREYAVPTAPPRDVPWYRDLLRWGPGAWLRGFKQIQDIFYDIACISWGFKQILFQDLIFFIICHSFLFHTLTWASSSMNKNIWCRDVLATSQWLHRIRILLPCHLHPATLVHRSWHASRLSSLDGRFEIIPGKYLLSWAALVPAHCHKGTQSSIHSSLVMSRKGGYVWWYYV